MTDPYSPPDNCLPDSWGFGCLIWELFNPDQTLTERAQLTNPVHLQRIPKALLPDYRRLVASSATRGAIKRFTLAQFLKSSRASDKNGFLANDYVDTLLFLEEIQLKDSEDKVKFLNQLTSQVSTFPDDVCRHKILPHLVNGLRFGSAGIDALLPTLKLIPLLADSDFDTVVLPCLLKLFSSSERLVRVKLLENLPQFVNYLSNQIVENQIYTTVLIGFNDSNPVVREATIRAMLHLAPKLGSKQLNDSLLKQLILLQTRDEQGGIRTNSTVCLARLANYFTVQTQQGPLLNGFLRATRDSFAPARQAALTALIATQNCYTDQLLAGKVLPCLSFLIMDLENSIRLETFRALRSIIDHLEQANQDRDSCPTATTGDQPDKSNATKPQSAMTQWAISALAFSTRFLNQTPQQQQQPSSSSINASVPPTSTSSSLSSDSSSLPGKSQDTKPDPSSLPVVNKPNPNRSNDRPVEKEVDVELELDDWCTENDDNSFNNDDDGFNKSDVIAHNLNRMDLNDKSPSTTTTSTTLNTWDSDAFFNSIIQETKPSQKIKLSSLGSTAGAADNVGNGDAKSVKTNRKPVKLKSNTNMRNTKSGSNSVTTTTNSTSASKPTPDSNDNTDGWDNW